MEQLGSDVSPLKRQADIRTAGKEANRQLYRGLKYVAEHYIPWAERAAWEASLGKQSLTDENPLAHFAELRDSATAILNVGLLESLASFHQTQSLTALVVRNCPIDKDIPPTPYSGYLPAAAMPVACQVNLALHALMGLNSIVYKGENKGFLFRQVVPARAAARDESSHGSFKRFGYHVDNPDLPLNSEPLAHASACPEYLSLYGVRCDTRVATTLFPVDEIVTHCPPALLEALQKPEYGIKRPDSFGAGKAQTINLPLLSRGSAGEWLCRFDETNAFGLNTAAEETLSELKDMLRHSRLALSLLLLPGDFLIFKNQRILHAREAFLPRMDGTDRWLIRLFGMADKSRIRIANPDGSREFEVLA